MIAPSEGFFDSVDRRRVRQGGTLNHHHWDLKRPRRGDLAVASVTAAIFGNNYFDIVPLQHSAIVRLVERPTGRDISRIWDGKRRVYGIDTADKVAVLRRVRERRDVFPAKRKKHTNRIGAQRGDGFFDRLYASPAIPGDRLPRGAAQRQERDSSFSRGRMRISRDLIGVWMRRIDQYADVLSGNEARESLGAAKASDPRRYALGAGIGGAASERQSYGYVGTQVEGACELARFRGASENEDLHDRS
jgi:hypothetical protein